MRKWDGLIKQLQEFAFTEYYSLSKEEFGIFKKGADIIQKYNK